MPSIDNSLPQPTMITYWWIRGPHCSEAKQIRQVPKKVKGVWMRGDIAFVCQHLKETQS